MLKIRCYQFSDQSGEEDLINLLQNLDNYLLISTQNNLETNDIQKNFYILIDNLLKLMNYLHINYNWSITPELLTKEIYTQLIKKTKELTKNLLIKSLTNTQYTPLIPIFHQHMPFTYAIETTYKLLINSILDIKPETGIYIQQILSICLTDAAIYNNAYAIKILINEYNVSPTVMWHPLCITYKNIAINNMPIMYITEAELTAKLIKFFTVSHREQEHMFIMMLHKIDFSNELLYVWQIQEIFRCSFKNNFILAINYLLTQQYFCQRLRIEEDDVIMMAFSSIAIPGYQELINIIFNHANILHHNQELENKILKINEYKTKFNNLNELQKSYNNYNDNILKVILNFIKIFILRYPEQNALYELLTITKTKIEKLQLENDYLTEYNQQLQTNMVLFKTNQQSLQEQYNKLLYKHSLLHLQLHNTKHKCPILDHAYQQNDCNATSVEISSPTIPTIQRRFSYYL